MVKNVTFCFAFLCFTQIAADGRSSEGVDISLNGVLRVLTKGEGKKLLCRVKSSDAISLYGRGRFWSFRE